MLIRFRVSNFLSFKDEVEFSMVPGRSRQHPNHVISGGESRHAVDILRCAVIYGANASGKSNLVKAIDFARDFILDGTKFGQSIQVKPFKLDRDYLDKISKFEFEIRIDGKDFLYGFEITSEKVVSEWLYELKLTTQEMIYERRTSVEEKTAIEFGNLKFQSNKEKDFLDFVAMGTRSNQLFLTESLEKNIKLFEPVYRWFATSLNIVSPGARFLGFSEKITKDIELLAYFLEKFDTGICGIELRPTPVEEKFSKRVQKEIANDLTKQENKGRRITLVGLNGERLFLSMGENSKIVCQEVGFKHKMVDCQDETTFDLDEESDGSIRLIDFIPFLYLGEKHEEVFLVDELDRSLHPHLCYQLIELFLARESSTTQMIVTTHESNLLTFDLLRRDEIWFMEKNKEGSSKIYSLEEFTPRYDKDIQKGYLLGRFGAIPIIGKKSF